MSYIQRRKSNDKTHRNRYWSFSIINRIGKRNRRKQNKYERKNKYSRLIQNILQFSIVILQGILVFVTWRLVESAKEQSEASYAAAIATQQSAEAVEKSVDISKQSLEIQQRSMKIANRAYLSTSFPQKVDIVSDFEYKIKITNTGKTPAYKVKHITNFGVRKTIPDTLQVTNKTFLKSTSVLGGGASAHISLKKTFSDNQVTAILKKTIYLTITGTIKYLDIFKREQFLEFNLFYDINRKTFVYCEKHNNAS